MKLQLKGGVASPSNDPLPMPPKNSTDDVIQDFQDEIEQILEAITSLDMGSVGMVIETCMGLMGRCTEIHIELSNLELRERKAKIVKTVYLKPVMDLIEFVFRGGSRLTEVYRQELEMSK